jgi:dimethylglycine dehydrogenase
VAVYGHVKWEKMSRLAIPVQPMEHHYLLTDTIYGIANLESRLPGGIDYEANLYFRQERDGMLLGTYEPVGVPWKV